MDAHFECHITFVVSTTGTIPQVAAERIQDFAQFAVQHLGWKFSVIAGDPLLGPGPRFYATRHYARTKKPATVWEHMQGARGELEKLGFKVIRCKTEAIVQDERY